MDLINFKLQCVDLERTIRHMFLSNAPYYQEPILDGIVDLDAYFYSTPKIMWVLPQPRFSLLFYQSYRGGWNYCKDVINKATFTQLALLDKQYWGPILQLSASIYSAQSEIFKPLLKHPQNSLAIVQQLALVHINKSMDVAAVNQAAVNQEMVVKQLEVFCPDIVIAYNCSIDTAFESMTNCYERECSPLPFVKTPTQLFIQLNTNLQNEEDTETQLQNCLNLIVKML